jgi:hypothetical protein
MSSSSGRSREHPHQGWVWLHAVVCSIGVRPLGSSPQDTSLCHHVTYSAFTPAVLRRRGVGW